MLKKNSWLLCAALTSGLAQASAADLPSVASGSNMVTGLAYHLIDLDPSDGVTPWVTFNGNYVGVGAYLADGVTPFNALQGDLFSAPAGSYTAPDGTLTASYSPTEQSSRIRLGSADLQNITPDDGSLIHNGGLATGVVLTYGSQIDSTTGLPQPITGETNWTLSANTALVIDGMAQFTGHVDLSQLGSGALVQGVNDGQYTFSLEIFNLVYINLGVHGGANFEANPTLRTVQSFDAAGPIGLSNDQSDTNPFAVRLDNTGAETVAGYLEFSSATFASITFGPGIVPEIPAIPEPSTYALMALGLGLMGWRVRNRSV